ncbi:MAG: hypothetical protein IPP97_23420 [Candidatus Obscuribacter sp.]|nr:hypothetical protein [Candidatus Obscuribacter sp.]MBK9206335.1 hypothetical protein [Candidatus Obscuribacter sp.]MBK9618237.1 hypothetical protein [Candidatus Obscuribacter sp.]MBL0188684.1 hypothetical protein [Candidatus Obscuribacter sp.]
MFWLSAWLCCGVSAYDCDLPTGAEIEAIEAIQRLKTTHGLAGHLSRQLMRI